MGTPLGPKYIPYTYMDPLGTSGPEGEDVSVDVAVKGLGFRV